MSGHSPKTPKGQGGMAKPHTQKPATSGKPRGGGAAPKSTVKFGSRPKPV